jgi:hypothetical protein
VKAGRALISLVLAAGATMLRAQEAPPALDQASRGAVLDSLAVVLERMYVFPEVAARLRTDIAARRRRGEYDSIGDRPAFGRLLTDQLQAISRDRHLRVRAGTGAGAVQRRLPAAGSPGPRIFGRIERLEGNVVYVELASFAFPVDAVRDQVRDVMSAAADAAALIIDVRRNGGGSPQLVALVSSYLFGEQPVHLNSLYFRPADRTEHFHTDPSVSGARFGPDKPLYVLTSSSTFSAAEEFSYNLRSLGRATIVGETTGGGAHPGQAVSLGHGLEVFVSTGRAINPVTGTNWEGVGVVPHVSVAADSALAVAHRMARERTSTR